MSGIQNRSDGKLSMSNKYYKYPTISQFENFLAPLPDPSIVSNNDFLRFKIPPYLQELPCLKNPFSLIKTRPTKDLKADDMKRKAFDNQRTKYTVQEYVKRDVRIRFNACERIRHLKVLLDYEEKTEEVLDQGILKMPPTEYFTNVNFIIDKRKACRLELAIKKSEQQIVDLETVVEIEEKFIHTKYEQLRNNKAKEDEYLKTVCEKTSRISKLVDKQTLKRNRISEKLREAKFRMSKINAEFVELEVEYLKSKSYRRFLARCYKQNEDKHIVEKKHVREVTPIEKTLRGLNILMDSDITISKVTDDDPVVPNLLDEKDTANSLDTSNLQKVTLNLNQNASCKGYPITYNNLILTGEQLNKLKTDLFLGQQNVNNEDNVSDAHDLIRPSIYEDFLFSIDESPIAENAMYFPFPQQLVDVISDLELNNLSLIENLQEQEKMCDSISRRTQLIKRDMDNKINVIDNHITSEQNRVTEMHHVVELLEEREKYFLKFNDVHRYKAIFHLVDIEVNTMDEMVLYLTEVVNRLCQAVFHKTDPTETDIVDMLGRVESHIDNLYLDLRKLNSKDIRKAKKKIDEDRILASRLKKTEYMIRNENFKLQKAIEEAKKPPRHRYGRKVVYRSKPIKTFSKLIGKNRESLRHEEQAFFFT